MKKCFVLILTCVLVNILPAEDFALSAGAGLSVGGLFTRYTLTGNGNMLGDPVDVEAKQEMDQFNFGGFLFFDATWAEFSVGVQGGLNNYKETVTISDPGTDDIVYKGEGSEIMLTLTLLGKYPFTLSDKLKVFPLLGLDYQIALMETRKPEGLKRRDRTHKKYGDVDSNDEIYELSVWNSLFILIGGGVDYNLTSNMFLRGELLYGFRLQTFYEVDALELAKKRFNANNPELSGLTSGPALRVATGWRF